MNWKNMIVGIVAAGAMTAGAGDEVKVDAWALNKNWKADKGAVVGQSTGNTVVKLKDKVVYNKVEFEASLSPVKAKGTSWKTSGIQIVSGGNFWQLALIESPDEGKNAKIHFIELKEMYKGKWGGEAKLKCLVMKTNKWEYGKTYKLKIKMDSKRIDGYVTDEKGKQIAHIAYQLKPVSVTSGTPALRVACMETKYSNINIQGDKK